MRSLCLVLLGLSACVPRHEPAPWAVGIRVRGPEPSGWLLTDPDLPPLADDRPHRAGARETAQAARDALQSQQTHWWQFIPLTGLIRTRTTAEPSVLEADRGRVEAWLHDRGWVDAEVELEVDAPKDRLRVVTFRVEAGERAMVIARLAGASGLPASLVATLEAALPPPGPWDRERIGKAVVALEGSLRASGYGHGQASVERAGGLATFTVAPGPLVSMAGVRWVGIEGLDRDVLTRMVRPVVREGAPWDGDGLDALARKITVRPGIEATSVRPGVVVDGEAPVTFIIEESPPITWTPRYSIGSDGALFSATGGAGFQAHAVGRRLVSTRGFVDFGYRLLPTTPASPGAFTGNHGPTGAGLLELDAPLSVLGRVGLYARAEGLVDVRRGYHSVEPEAAVGLSWSTTTTHLVAAVVVDHDLFTATPAQRPVYDTWFGAEGDRFLPRYTLLYPEFRADIDTLDRTVDPHRGVHAKLSGVPLALFRGRPWHRYDVDIRGFVPVRPRAWTAVFRARSAATSWSVPDPPRLFGLRHHLGGPYDMRGWSFRRLGPPGYVGSPDDTRIGGNVLLFGSVESRHRLHPHLTLIPFIDVGRTWEDWRDRTVGDATLSGVRLADLASDIGLGIDVRTPLGTLRTSVAAQPWPTAGLVNPAPRWAWQANLDMRL
ncbi:MAG: hypothetical protein ACI9K2_002426 [Myxococcota bacterium]